MSMGAVSKRLGRGVTMYGGLVEEALSGLGVTLDNSLFSEFFAGEDFLGAVDVLWACSDKGVRLSEQVMSEVETDAHMFLADKNEWHVYRHYAKKALEYIEIIRALPQQEEQA